jgi:hypothetical protein
MVVADLSTPLDRGVAVRIAVDVAIGGHRNAKPPARSRPSDPVVGGERETPLERGTRDGVVAASGATMPTRRSTTPSPVGRHRPQHPPGGLGHGGGRRSPARSDPASLDEGQYASRWVERRRRKGGIEMARGGRQVPATTMDPPERDLDTGEHGRVGQRRRRLQLGGRLRILPQAAEQLADPRMEVAGVRPTERDGCPEVIDRLSIGEHRLGAIRGVAERFGRGPRSPGFALVDRDQSESSQVIATSGREVEPQGVSRPGMEQPTTREAGPVVRRVASADRG